MRMLDSAIHGSRGTEQETLERFGWKFLASRLRDDRETDWFSKNLSLL
jgi:hypothetical protein